MSKQHYPEEFKIEAVGQITERGYKVADVSARIGVSQHRYQWIQARRARQATFIGNAGRDQEQVFVLWTLKSSVTDETR